MCAVRRALKTLFGFVYIVCLAELLPPQTVQPLLSYSVILLALGECSHFWSFGSTRTKLLYFTIFFLPFKCQLKKSTGRVLTMTVTRTKFYLFWKKITQTE